MVDFDKFEKQVKEKYGEQQFPFDEANWEKARQMIDASRKDKNRGGFWLISSVAVVLTTGLVYYFGFSKGSDAINGSAVATNQQQNKEIVVSGNDVQKSQDNSTVDHSLASNNENAVSNTGTSSNSGSASSENKRQISTSNNSSTPNHNSNYTTTNSAKNNTDIRSENGSSEEHSTVKNEEGKSSSSNASGGSKMNEDSKQPESKKNNASKTGVKNNLPSESGSASNSNQNPKNHTNTSTDNGTVNNNRMGEGDDTNSSPANTNKKNTTPVATDSTSIVKIVGVKIEESKVTDSLPDIAQIPADSIKVPATPPAGPKGDGISYATNVKLEHEYKNFLYMEAGASYLLGWNSGAHEAGGFNLIAGLNFQHYFTSNISAQIGVQYNTISNLTNSTYTISAKNYDFGLQQDVTTISYQKLHYVVAPVKLALTVRKNNIIGIGCNVGYLLNSDSKKEKYTTSNNNSSKNNLTSSKEKGYVQGFNPFDIQASVFYRRKIFKGFGMNAEFIYGFTDVKNNDFFKSNSFDRNMGFKLTLCYDLFKK